MTTTFAPVNFKNQKVAIINIDALFGKKASPKAKDRMNIMNTGLIFLMKHDGYKIVLNSAARDAKQKREDMKIARKVGADLLIESKDYFFFGKSEKTGYKKLNKEFGINVKEALFVAHTYHEQFQLVRENLNSVFACVKDPMALVDINHPEANNTEHGLPNLERVINAAGIARLIPEVA